MAKIKVYSLKTKTVKEIALPKKFGGEVRLGLLAQALHVYRAEAHGGRSKTKTRGEVNRTTKKWYRQKGTGGARHGARSAPIFVGGGKAHGPKLLKRERGLTTKMRQKALASSMGIKVKLGQVCGASGLGEIKKTKEAADFLAKVKNDNKRFLLVLGEKNYEAAKFFGNIASVKVMRGMSLNAYDVYLGGLIILDEDLLKVERKKK